MAVLEALMRFKKSYTMMNSSAERSKMCYLSLIGWSWSGWII